LLTQLFGDRLMIANATGCSSIYGGFTALSVGLTNGIFYGCYRLLSGQHSADGKEASLHDGIDAAAHPGLARDLGKKAPEDQAAHEQ
jgi:pyruvate/2-oxoacid:ferredoxin oxidoreductase beta subunit